MGLLDRLKAAEAERKGEDDEVIDLRDDAVDETPAPPQIIWGRPSTCPACGDAGYLDRIDLVRRMMFQHCPSCQHRWEVHESETVRVIDA